MFSSSSRIETFAFELCRECHVGCSNTLRLSALIASEHLWHCPRAGDSRSIRSAGVKLRPHGRKIGGLHLTSARFARWRLAMRGLSMRPGGDSNYHGPCGPQGPQPDLRGVVGSGASRSSILWGFADGSDGSRGVDVLKMFSGIGRRKQQVRNATAFSSGYDDQRIG